MNPYIDYKYNQYLEKHINNPNIYSLIELSLNKFSDKDEIKHQIPHFIFPLVGLYVTSIPRILILLLNDKYSLNKVINEINSIDKASIEKKIEELEQQETDISKEQLNIAKAKIDALDSNYYEKI